jgi:hypothetical protein
MCTARFNIQKFYALPTQRIYVLYKFLQKQRLFPYTTLNEYFYIRDCVCVCVCVACAVGTDILTIIQDNRRPGVDSRWWAKWQWNRFFSEFFGFPLCTYIIPSTLHTHFHLHVALTRRTNGRHFGTFQKASPFRKSGSIWTENYFYTNVKINVHTELQLCLLFLWVWNFVAHEGGT